MKQKTVIQVFMNDDKSRSKALKIAVGVYGVESAALGEKDKNQLEVIGEGVDPVKLTSSLRKKLGKCPYLFTCLIPDNEMGNANIISVSNVEEKKEEKKDEAIKVVEAPIWTHGTSSIPVCVCYTDPEPFSCSIL